MMVVGGQELEIPASGSTKIGGRGRGEVISGEKKSNLLEVRKSRDREAVMVNGSSLEILTMSRLIEK